MSNTLKIDTSKNWRYLTNYITRTILATKRHQFTSTVPVMVTVGLATLSVQNSAVNSGRELAPTAYLVKQ